MYTPDRSSSSSMMLDKCIIHGYGYLGSRITGLIEGTRRVQATWSPIGKLTFRVVAIVERDPHHRETAQARHPSIPCFADIEEALEVASGANTFIKDFTSPNGRLRLLSLAQQAGVSVLLEKPLSSPGVEVSLGNYRRIASVSMSEAFNPVVHALASKLAGEAAEMRSLSFVRVNSLALDRLRNPEARSDIVGGAFVDKLSHDVHLLASGAVFGTTDVEFGTPEVQEIVYDIRVQEGATNLCFTSLNGTPLSPLNAEAPGCDPAEMMVDFKMPVKVGSQTFPTRWIASWSGVPSDLATRIGIQDSHVKAALMVSKPDNDSPLYPRTNLKLIVCDYVNAAGQDVQLICNLQARGPINAWLMERRSGTEYLLPVEYSVSIIKSMQVFSQRFHHGGYLDLEGIEKADRATLKIRSEFRRPLTDELQIERSLTVLDHNHSVLREPRESQDSSESIYRKLDSILVAGGSV
ncbi:hypothetical protein FPANT_9943 [Fusarium pseudoanthophilum]|uniref:Uncharacterized protein n=1 Tax=Fusarium pseudoanthophilum TaxID=48495 RepID=A0A8H5KSB2_9HYPO|nr:hypothetical protein FPANT_9943 [Fusarium pseudoanthophilum]